MHIWMYVEYINRMEEFQRKLKVLTFVLQHSSAQMII